MNNLRYSRGDGFFDFISAVFLVVVVILFWQNLTNDDEVEALNADSNIAGYQVSKFTMKGKGESEKLACIASDKSANEECPYSAKRISESSLTWVKPILFGSNHWECRATYICKKAAGNNLE